jgi:hypothetical protein
LQRAGQRKQPERLEDGDHSDGDRATDVMASADATSWIKLKADYNSLLVPRN